MKLFTQLGCISLCVAAFGAQATEIEFWHSMGHRTDALCKAFNQQSQDHVNCIDQGDYVTAMQKAVAAVRSGKQPMLMQFYDAGTLDIMLSGIYEPVEKLMPQVDWHNYINGARSYYETKNGSLLSQPWNGSTLVLYTNKTLLKKAGISHPPATYTALHKDMVKLKQAGVDCPYATDGHPWRILEQVAARHGVPIATKNNGYDGLDAVYIFNHGLLARHLKNLQAWKNEGLLKLNAQTKTGDFVTAFASGECAMMEGSVGSFGSVRQSLGDQVQLSLAPMYQGYQRHNTFIGGGAIWVLKGHSPQEIKVAKAFLNFVRQPAQQKAFTALTGYLPVTKAGYQYIMKSPDANQPQFGTVKIGYESLNQPTSPASRGIRLGFFKQFRAIFMEETQKAFHGDISMQRALDQAKKRGDVTLRRFERTYAHQKMPE